MPELGDYLACGPPQTISTWEKVGCGVLPLTWIRRMMLSYGSQQLTFVNACHESWCYLTVACFFQFYDEPDRYAFAYVLCPGGTTATDVAIIRLKRTSSKLRKASGGVKIRVRIDGE